MFLSMDIGEYIGWGLDNQASLGATYLGQWPVGIVPPPSGDFDELNRPRLYTIGVRKFIVR